MSTLTVLIADNEGSSRQRIRRLVQSESDAEVVGECCNGVEALAAIREKSPDVVCLDVQMPELDGFGVLQALRGSALPQVLFITAHDAHALRAFDVHAVDYVLKPVDALRFRRAFDRARRAHAHATSVPALPVPVSAGVGGRPYASRILVKQGGRMIFVKVDEIDWVEADRNYVRLHVGAVMHTVRERISHLADTLDPHMFARIHRSTIVNLNRVREMQPWLSGDYVVLLDTGARLRLSRHYRSRVERQVGAA